MIIIIIKIIYIKCCHRFVIVKFIRYSFQRANKNQSYNNNAEIVAFEVVKTCSNDVCTRIKSLEGQQEIKLHLSVAQSDNNDVLDAYCVW